MTARQPCPPAPGPLEAFAVQFDSLFGSLGQRRSFRGYLSGLLPPSARLRRQGMCSGCAFRAPFR
jgi:hypothetical protein